MPLVPRTEYPVRRNKRSRRARPPASSGVSARPVRLRRTASRRKRPPIPKSTPGRRPRSTGAWRPRETADRSSVDTSSAVKDFFLTRDHSPCSWPEAMSKPGQPEDCPGASNGSPSWTRIEPCAGRQSQSSSAFSKTFGTCAWLRRYARTDLRSQTHDLAPDRGQLARRNPKR